MCGWLAVVGTAVDSETFDDAVHLMGHRGPDARGSWSSPSGLCVLGHCRLSIIDLSPAGVQPMVSGDGRYAIVLNGEIYNYIELRKELEHRWTFRTHTDTEVLLACYACWGRSCLDRLLGMFSFAIWDDRERSLFVARDRFGVKPLYYTKLPGGALACASEIKALRKLGVETGPDTQTWATYLTYGLSDHTEATFWKGIKHLRPGHTLDWNCDRTQVVQWYDLGKLGNVAVSQKPEPELSAEYMNLMRDSIQLRFRADVPVGINLSGGIDSSILLRQVHLFNPDSVVCAFTFTTGDPTYDQLDEVRQMIACTNHPHLVCRLDPAEVPQLAARIQSYQEEPYGGLATLAYSKVFREARDHGVVVLLDGQGLDEQWAGYDYYAQTDQDKTHRMDRQPALGPVQGALSKPVRPECLVEDFRNLALPFIPPVPFSDELRNAQYRDIVFTKIPRALRFNDRISMMAGTELRNPFLDHRLFEFALVQRRELKIRNGVHKWFLRKMHDSIMPINVIHSPKQPLQTPQREWLADQLKPWALELLNDKNLWSLGWLLKDKVEQELRTYFSGRQDNSFFLWQWLNLALWLNCCR